VASDVTSRRRGYGDEDVRQGGAKAPHHARFAHIANRSKVGKSVKDATAIEAV
jgi:hypothetical protein